MKIQLTLYGRVIPGHALRGFFGALGTVVVIFVATLPFYDRMSDGFKRGLGWSVAGILTLAANEFRKAVKRAPPAQTLTSGTPPERAIVSGHMDHLIGHEVRITMRNGSTIEGVFDGLDDSLEQVTIRNATVTLTESLDVGSSHTDQWSVYVPEIAEIKGVGVGSHLDAPQ